MRPAIVRKLIVLLLILGGLPVVARWYRGDPGARCELDGVPIERTYRVRVVENGSVDHEFCCVLCARLWIERAQRAISRILVTDEATLEELDHDQCWYVTNTVITTPTTGNRVHVFGSRERAEQNAAVTNGRVLKRSEIPLELLSVHESP